MTNTKQMGKVFLYINSYAHFFCVSYLTSTFMSPPSPLPYTAKEKRALTQIPSFFSSLVIAIVILTPLLSLCLIGL